MKHKVTQERFTAAKSISDQTELYVLNITDNILVARIKLFFVGFVAVVLMWWL